jgi:Rrf2 family protein
VLLSNAGEYAVRAMLHLASLETNKVIKIVEISKTWDIPESFLRKILVSLSKAGLVVSSRGVNGGYSLARPTHKITLLDIVIAIEGNIYLNKCMMAPEMCENIDWCPVHNVWTKAQHAYSEVLNSTTLEDFNSNSKLNEYIKSKI